MRPRRPWPPSCVHHCGRALDHTGPCGHYVGVWPPPVEQTDPAARRVAWVLYAFACVLVCGLVAYACASCARPSTQPAIKAPPPAYGHKVL